MDGWMDGWGVCTYMVHTVVVMCVRAAVCRCVCALTSLLPSLHPPHSDSLVTEGLTTSHTLPHHLPCLLSSYHDSFYTPHCSAHRPPSVSLCRRVHYRPLCHFYPPPPSPSDLFSSLSPPSSVCGFFRLASCSLHPRCSLSLSLWKPQVDTRTSEV